MASSTAEESIRPALISPRTRCRTARAAFVTAMRPSREISATKGAACSNSSTDGSLRYNSDLESGFTSQRMHVRQQILYLLLIQRLSIRRHLAAAEVNNFSHAIIVCR